MPWHTRLLRQAVSGGNPQEAERWLRFGADPSGFDVPSVDPQTGELLRVARQVRALYPPPTEFGMPAAGSPLDRLVQDYRIEEARAQLQQLGPEPLVVWLQAAAAGREDVLRAMLAVLPENVIRELASTPVDARTRAATGIPDGAYTDVLHAALHGRHHSEALRRYLDGVPHLPPVRPALNNGQQGYECRHWVTAWLDQSTRRPPHAAVNYTSFESAAVMANTHSAAELHARSQALVAAAKETYLLDQADFGRMVAGQLARLGDGQSVSMKVAVARHAMALELRRLDAAGVPTYHARFYDPSMTTLHASASTQNLDVAATWNPTAFLASPELAREYYKDQGDITLVFVVPDEGVPAQAGPRLANRQLTGCSIEDPLRSPTALWHLINNGFLGELHGLPEAVARMDDQEALRVLGARPAGMAMAVVCCMHEGDRATISLYAKALARASEAVQDEILESCTSQFHNLMATTRNPEVVRGFHQLLTELGLPAERIGEILATPDRRGALPLHWPMSTGHAEGVTAYGEALLASPMPGEHLMVNLQAWRDGVGSGLMQALRNGHADAIRAFGAIVQRSGLSQAQRWQVLSAVHREGDTVHNSLLEAARGNHVEAVRAYGEVLRQCLGPDYAPTLLERMLTSRDAQGRPQLAELWTAPERGEARQALRELINLIPLRARQGRRVNDAAQGI